MQEKSRRFNKTHQRIVSTDGLPKYRNNYMSCVAPLRIKTTPRDVSIFLLG